MLLGTLAAMAHGACLPLLWLFFGSLTNTFISQDISSGIAENASDLFNLTINCSSVFNIPNGSAIIENATINGIIQGFGFDADVRCLLGDEFISEVNSDIFIFIYFGIAVFLAAMTHVSFFQIAAERQVYKIRLQYYRAILRQNVAWFDANPSGELATRLTE